MKYLYFLDKPDAPIYWDIPQYKENPEPEEVFAIYVQFSSIDYSKYPNLEYVLCPCTNISHIQPVPQNVKVFNLDNKEMLFKLARSTAEWCVRQMLNLLSYNREELTNKAIGFIGYGRIAQQVSRMLEGFKVDIYYYDPDINYPEFYCYMGNLIRCGTMDVVFARSDIVSLNLTSDESTKNIINSNLLNTEGKCRYLINSSRGNVLDIDAVISALSSHKLKGFATDVTDGYTEGQLHSLGHIHVFDRQTQSSNIIVTDHIAGKGHESRMNTDEYVLSQFLEEMNNGTKTK